MPHAEKTRLLEEEVERLRPRVGELEQQQRVESDPASEPGAVDQELDVVIEDRIRIEQDLRLSAEIMENMSEGVCLLRASDGLLVFTNPRFDEMFGYETGELAGQHAAILNAPGDDTPDETAGKILNDLERTGRWSGEVHNVRNDGNTFWTHSSVSTFEHPAHRIVRVAVVEDVTERKRAEEALRVNEERLELASSVNNDGLYDWDLVEKTMYFDPRYYTTAG